MQKLAIISSHPIQYYAPWYKYLANLGNIKIKVFYLWDFGIKKTIDVNFQQAIQWDIPLLDGYDYEFVANVSKNPGTHHFWGLQNPSLMAQVAAYNPDVVLLMVYNYASIYHFLVTWNRDKIPLMFRGDSHRLIDNKGIKSWTRRKFISLIYHHFAACLYVGKANYDYFRYHGVSENKLFFSPHSVDNQRFIAQAATAKLQAEVWKQELGIPQKHAVIVFVGKFELKKRPLDLLDAFLQAGLTDVSLLFVGAGNLEKNLKQKAVGNPNIYFAPFQNQSLIPRAYAVADLLVLPSYGGGETWGLVVNEAMCLGLPIIVSSHVGCAQDLVHPYDNGLVFEAGNVSALAKSLSEAFQDRKRLKSWGEKSMSIISNYSYTQTTQGLIEAIQYLI